MGLFQGPGQLKAWGANSAAYKSVPVLRVYNFECYIFDADILVLIFTIFHMILFTKLPRSCFSCWFLLSSSFHKFTAVDQTDTRE